MRHVEIYHRVRRGAGWGEDPLGHDVYSRSYRTQRHSVPKACGGEKAPVNINVCHVFHVSVYLVIMLFIFTNTPNHFFELWQWR